MAKIEFVALKAFALGNERIELGETFSAESASMANLVRRGFARLPEEAPAPKKKTVKKKTGKKKDA